MPDKRKQPASGEDAGTSNKKQRKGFSVGPANLPDGTYRRKNQKIKNALIERAQIKKTYAKLKRKENFSDDPPSSTSNIAKSHSPPKDVQEVASSETEQTGDQLGSSMQPSTIPHPDRADLMSRPVKPAELDENPDDRSQERQSRRRKRPRPDAFSREAKEAQSRREEAEARRKARDEAERQRQARIEDRERFRKAMAKARNGNGQRKLGRESRVLLEKAKRIVGQV